MEAEKSLQEVQELSMKQLARDVAAGKAQGGVRFAFLLGSGASVSSGIKTGKELAQKWYEELKNDCEESGIASWIKSDSKLKGVEDSERRAEFYSHIYQKRFGHNPELGYAELRRVMESAIPSLGYFILAQIVSETPHNIVLTTNFDNLLEDAVRSYTEKVPFVAGHELLADHVATHKDRPIIVKLHRDLLLKPLNTEDEISKLAESWCEALTPILNSRPLIVLGYGGNDGSLMGFLQAVDPKKRKGIYWCLRRDDKLSQGVQKVLQGKCDRVVRITDFDEFMYSCAFALGYKEKLGEVADLGAMLRSYQEIQGHRLIRPLAERLRSITEVLEKFSKSAKEGGVVSGAAIEILPDVYKIIRNANAELDIDKAEKIFREGLVDYPQNTAILRAYGVFLYHKKKDYKAAQQRYEETLRLDPDYAQALGDYAVLLVDIYKEYDQGECYYERALTLSPCNPNVLSNYATFLTNIRGKHDLAEQYYEKALRVKSGDCRILGAYAVFMADIRRNYDVAEKYYKKVLDIDPEDVFTLGNYAVFLMYVRQQYEQAELCFRNALSLAPDNYRILGNYAVFLMNFRQEYDQAGEIYQKALELAPEDLNNLKNYVVFLSDIRRDKGLADEYYKKVLEIEAQVG